MPTLHNLLKKLTIVFITGICSGCLFHYDRFPSPAQISTKDGTACFSIGDSANNRNHSSKIDSVIVYVSEKEDWKQIWERNFAAQGESFYLSAGQCIKYGEGVSAPNLEHGKKYSVLILSSIRNEDYEYDSYFCVTKGTAGEVTAHRVTRNIEDGGYNWDICNSF